MNKFLPLSLLTLALLTACSSPPPANGWRYSVPEQPEGTSGSSDKPGWAYARQAVAAANPLATDAGLQILRAGGSALDAAIAVQLVLGLVEPQSSGIGGGAFLLHFDGRRVQAFDGRETAPAGARTDMFLENGKPLPFDEAVLSGRAVGVPGAVRMLETAHRQHGTLPWGQLFTPAITLAEQGFQVSPRLHTLLQNDPHLRKDPLAARFFYDAKGQAWPVGHVLRNPEYAHVLRRIAAQGSRALHEGPVAQAIVARTAQPPLAGTLSLQDLQTYQPREREALCLDHTARARTYRICGFPPPSSGQIAVGQILGLLAHTTPQGAEWAGGLPSPDFVHRYTEASRLAFADRAQFVADPDFVSAPGGDWRSLLAPDYLRLRSTLIGAQSMKVAPPGQPGGAKTSFAPMPMQPEYGTSHISVVDAPDRQPGRAGQAPAFVHVAHAGVRQGQRRAAHERRQPGRGTDHPLHRQAAGWHAARWTQCPTGHQPAQFRLVEWPHPSGIWALWPGHDRSTEGPRSRSARDGDDQRPSSHRADRHRLVRRRRPQARRDRAGRLSASHRRPPPGVVPLAGRHKFALNGDTNIQGDPR